MSTAKSTSRFHSGNRWHRWLLAATLGVVFVLGYAGQSVRAEDDDDELPDTKLFKQFLHSFGLRREGDTIEYRERAPLVLPPGRDLHQLPPPETGKQAVSKTANWPDDPDLKRARKAKAERKYSNPDPDDVNRPLLPSQYSLPGGGSASSRPNGTTRTTEDEQRASTPKELGAKNFWSSFGWGGTKDEYATFTSEPARDRLVDPPAGYRTPSPNQPYGVGAKTWTGKADTPDTHNDVVK